jgi:hypothetical protein|tara:strand:- start:2950 stop:4134 length:1185 start_codon:yes stop_codon:yes gene_type:complete
LDVRILDLGLQPISNRLKKSENEKEPLFRLALSVCNNTGQIRIEDPFPVKELRSRFPWLDTNFEPETHLDDFVEKVIFLTGIKENAKIGAFSFKDDSFLTRLERRGFVNTWRLDPKEDLGIEYDSFGIETLQDRFVLEKVKEVQNKHGYSDIFIVRHAIEHSYNIEEFLQVTKLILKPHGHVIWELPDCEKSLSMNDYTMIWEEHIHYFTQFTFKHFIESEGFEVLLCESIDYPFENSIIAITKLSSKETKTKIDNSKKLSNELNRALNFFKFLSSQKKIIRSNLELIRKENGPIVVYGAGHLAVSFLSILEISDLIEFAVDDNEKKVGMWMPIGNLEIKASAKLYQSKPGVCLLCLNPQNQPQILKKHERYTSNGGIFASIFPGSFNYLNRLL